MLQSIKNFGFIKLTAFLMSIVLFYFCVEFYFIFSSNYVIDRRLDQIEKIRELQGTFKRARGTEYNDEELSSEFYSIKHEIIKE